MARSGPPRVDARLEARTAVRITPSIAVSGVFASYLWKNVVIVLWFDAATVDSIVAFDRSCMESVREFPTGLSSVHIMVPGGKSMPSPEARAAISRLTREYEQYFAGTAVVIPGAGFWASALRGMVTAGSILARSKIKPRICADFADVIDWLPDAHEQRTGVRIEAQDLLSALQSAERAGLQAVA